MISVNLYFRFQNNLFLVNACFHCCFDNLPNSQKKNAVTTHKREENSSQRKYRAWQIARLSEDQNWASQGKKYSNSGFYIYVWPKKIRAYVTWIGREENRPLTQITNLSRIF